MEEPKNISFSTIGPAKASKKKVKRRRAARITIKLPESNEKSCPEYNYGELLSQYMAKQKKQQQMGSPGRRPPPSTPGPDSDEDDEALQALAKSLERKYGNTYNTTGKRKKRRKDSDFNALGEGYDETDSFIDNTGAYDEVVPSNMETKHGGFYINSGELDYRELSDSEEALANNTLTSTPAPSAKRKLRVESDDDDEERAALPQTQQEGDTVTNGPTSGAGGAAMDEGELLRKRRKLISKLNAKKSAQQPDHQPTPVESTNTTSISSATTAAISTTSSTTTTAATTTTSMSSVAASIEAVVNKVRNEVSKTSNVATEHHAAPALFPAPAPYVSVSSEALSPPSSAAAAAAVSAEAAPGASTPPTATAVTVPATAETSGGSDDASDSSSSSSSSSSDDSSTSSDSSSSSDSEKEEEEDVEANANAALEASVPTAQESAVAVGSTVAAVVEAVATTADSMDTQPTALPVVAASAGLTTSATAAVREGKTLPDNLSPDLLGVIELLKEEGRKAIGCSSSQKFFTDKVKQLVLSIETKLQESGGRNKTQVYQYLSHHVPCGPATLVKRAKQMLQHVNENKVAQPLRHLKEVLDREMPVLMEAFAEECRLAAQQQSSDAPPPLSAVDDKKKHKMPKKRYNFTPESDACLQVVVSARVSQWLEAVGKKVGDTPEDFITGFLEREVRTLWPKGWVTTRQLYRQSVPTHASITSPLGEPPAKAVVKKALVVPSFPSVDAIPSSHLFSKPPPVALPKAAAVASTNNPIPNVFPVDVVGASKKADGSGKVGYEDELSLKLMQQKASIPQHSPEVMRHLPQPNEAEAAFQAADLTRKASVDSRRQEFPASAVPIDRESISMDIIPPHKIQQLEKITDQLPPSLRTELTISYKGVNAVGGSQSLEVTPTKVIEGTNKLNDYRDDSRSSSDAVAASKEPVHSQNGSDNTPSAEKDAPKKPSPISVESVSSINKMSDVEFAVETQPSQVKTSLKFTDKTTSLEVGHKMQPTLLAEKQSNHSKALSKGVDTTVDIRSSKHQAALLSPKDAQIIDLSSDEERPMRPRVTPVTAAPVPMPAQFSPPPSTALIVTPVGRNPSPVLRESAPTSREALSASPDSLSYIRDFATTIKKPVPAAAELAPSLKKPVPTAGELAPSIRKPVPTGGELSTPIKKPIPTVGELALATKSPSSPGFNDSSNSKLDEEMDDVMNELLQISKKKQQSSPVPSGSNVFQTSSVPSSQQRDKQHRISSSVLMAEHSNKSPSGAASVSVTDTLLHKAEKAHRSAPPAAVDALPHKKKVSPLARLQQEQQQQQQLLLQQKLLQQSHQQNDAESYQNDQLDKYQDKYKADQKQSQPKKQKTSHNPTSLPPSGLDATYYHSSASGLTITSKTLKQPQLSPNALLPSTTSIPHTSANHSLGSNYTPSKPHHHATSVPTSNSHYPLNSPYQLSPPSQFSPTNSHTSSSALRGSNTSYPSGSQHSSLNHNKSLNSSTAKVSQSSKSPRSSNSSLQVNNSHNSSHSNTGSSSHRSGSSHHQSTASQGFPSMIHSAASSYSSTKSSAHNNGGSASLHSSQAQAAQYANTLQHSSGSGSGKVPSPQYSPSSSHRSPSSSKHPFSIATLSTSSVKSTSPSHINSLHSAKGSANSNSAHSKAHSNSAHGGAHSNSAHSSAHSNSTHSSGLVGATSSAHRGVSLASSLHNAALPLAHALGTTPKLPTSSSKEPRDSSGSFKHRKTASTAVAASPEKESQFGMLTVEQQRELLLKQHQVQQLQQDLWLHQQKQSGASHNSSSSSSSNNTCSTNRQRW